MKEIVVDKLSSGQKIEKFVRHFLNDAPLGFIYKTFRKKDIKINGHWVNKDAIVYENDVVRIYVTDEQLADFSKAKDVVKRDFPYEIIFEDQNILIVNKPKGVLIYGDDKGTKDTLASSVLNYLYYKGEYDPSCPSFTPSPAHRLDRNTSGLVIFGKTDAALGELVELFKERDDISKHYLALVVGKTPDSGEINKPLKKNSETGVVTVCSQEQGGKTAITKYKVVKYYQEYTLLDIDLITGRTHQIRVHMSSIGHPVVGDNKYGDFQDCRSVKKLFKLESQFLHAYKIRFGKIKGQLSHLSGKQFEAKLPKELESILNQL